MHLHCLIDAICADVSHHQRYFGFGDTILEILSLMLLFNTDFVLEEVESSFLNLIKPPKRLKKLELYFH